MRADFTTLPHFSVSSAMSLPNSAGESARSRPWLRALGTAVPVATGALATGRKSATHRAPLATIPQRLRRRLFPTSSISTQGHEIHGGHADSKRCNHLCPDCDHTHKQRQRGQRGDFFNNGAAHVTHPTVSENPTSSRLECAFSRPTLEKVLVSLVALIMERFNCTPNTRFIVNVSDCLS
jgi:hypothetical protein